MASQNLAFCSQCDKKYSRPVGNRCKWLLNLSAPVVIAEQEDSVSATHPPLQQIDRRNAGLNLGQVVGGDPHPSRMDNLDTKLD